MKFDAEFLKKHFADFTPWVLACFALANIIIWLLPSTANFLALIFILIADGYILWVLYSFARMGDLDDSDDDKALKTKILAHIPTRVGGLVSFFSIFVSILFGFAANFVNLVNHACGKFDDLYFSYTTLATVGYGDLTPKGDTAKFLVMFEMSSGLLVLAGALSLIISRITNLEK